MSFKIILFNERVLWDYTPSRHNIRGTRGQYFIKGLENSMGNESEWNKNKKILGNFNCAMVKMDRDGGNKTQRLIRHGSNYALP